MSLSRRVLIRGRPVAGGAGGPWVGARGREAAVAALGHGVAGPPIVPAPATGEIRINSNENPLGPGPAALEALQGALHLGNRYPDNVAPSTADLRAILAEHTGVQPDHVVLGAGSGEILQNGVQAFTSPARALVTGHPSYELPASVARYLGTEVRAVRVDDRGRLDLDGMAEAVDGAGLVFVCNPNNPTGTVHSGDDIAGFVDRVRRRSPDTVIHVDEAYHDYVTDPAYRSAAALAVETPGVYVSRTFSKAYGMAGMRIGYAVGHRDTVARLRRFALTLNANTPGQIAAHAAIQDTDFIVGERRRNEEVKQMTVGYLEGAGYPTFDSQTNFVFVDLGRPAAAFRDACWAYGVRVGRDFPPFENSHCRISLGTLEEMERAIRVFDRVLEG